MMLAPWRSGYAAVCKTAYTGSNPVGASKFCFYSIDICHFTFQTIEVLHITECETK